MDFNDKLTADFPLMYREGADAWVGEGWEPIVYSLSFLIQSHLDFVNRNGKEVAQVEVTQVKEKFGGLRFYYDGGDDYIDGLVSMAETWASNTCEVCGAKGHTRSLSWVRTLCDEHYEEYKAKQTFIPKVDSTPDSTAN